MPQLCKVAFNFLDVFCWREILGHCTPEFFNRLADFAPTLLQMLGLPKPAEMTGESLIVG